MSRGESGQFREILGRNALFATWSQVARGDLGAFSANSAAKLLLADTVNAEKKQALPHRSLAFVVISSFGRSPTLWTVLPLSTKS